jgi:hypothetical protein
MLAKPEGPLSAGVGALEHPAPLLEHRQPSPPDYAGSTQRRNSTANAESSYNSAITAASGGGWRLPSGACAPCNTCIDVVNPGRSPRSQRPMLAGHEQCGR